MISTFSCKLKCFAVFILGFCWRHLSSNEIWFDKTWFDEFSVRCVFVFTFLERYSEQSKISLSQPFAQTIIVKILWVGNVGMGFWKSQVILKTFVLSEKVFYYFSVKKNVLDRISGYKRTVLMEDCLYLEKMRGWNFFSYVYLLSNNNVSGKCVSGNRVLETALFLHMVNKENNDLYLPMVWTL